MSVETFEDLFAETAGEVLDAECPILKALPGMEYRPNKLALKSTERHLPAAAAA